jgi:hypothetical protein
VLERNQSAHRFRGKNMNIKLTKSIGSLLLAIWLILAGLAAFLPVMAPLSPILAILAIAAGVFIAIGR